MGVQYKELIPKWNVSELFEPFSLSHVHRDYINLLQESVFASWTVPRMRVTYAQTWASTSTFARGSNPSQR